MYGHFNWRKSTIAKTPVTSKLYHSFAFLCVSLKYFVRTSEVDIATKGNILRPFVLRSLHLINIAKSPPPLPSVEQHTTAITASLNLQITQVHNETTDYKLYFT